MMQQFDQSRLAQHGLTRVTQIIGEAAWRVSREFKDAHPQVPWRRIAGYRHRLVHDYFSVDYDTVWQVATTHVAVLIEQLEQLLKSSS